MGLVVACGGPEREGQAREGGLLPVALAPTGSNLEQTVPNVFIRVVIGLSAGGEGLPCLTLNSPDCARHKTPSVSMSRGERGSGGEREREGKRWGNGEGGGGGGGRSQGWQPGESWTFYDACTNLCTNKCGDSSQSGSVMSGIKHAAVKCKMRP